MELQDTLFITWLVFRVLFIALVIFFVASGVDDLLFDMVYYVRRAFRAVFRRKVIRPVTRDQLKATDEKLCAIIVPCWHEWPVIGRMLLNTVSTIDYKNYVVFVGTYPNDDRTRAEVEKIREIYPNVEMTTTPSDGPTNKADCLNWVYQGILLYEAEHGVHFEMFVMHDSEDVIHPLSLAFYNYLMPRVDFIQLPVHPVETDWKDMTMGVYMDEFAESHTKDMRSREVLANSLPSAGVGTAMSRAVIEYLAEENGNRIFDITSVTEDYLMGLGLESFDGKKIFLQQQIEHEEADGSKRVEHIATRGMFPESFGDAVRQKSRWILGIGLQGWRAGWGKSLGAAWCLYRDRKGLLTNLLVVLGYVVFGFWAISKTINVASSDISMPPLVEPGEIWFDLMALVLGLLIWRIANRTLCAWYVYGGKHVILLIPRLFYGNVINFFATTMAIKHYVRARVSGVVPEWTKTEHSFPDEDQLRRYHRRLGDLLLERRWVSSSDLQEAVSRQKDSGKRLGEVLMEMGVLFEDDLDFALSVQGNHQTADVDPYDTDPDLLKRVPREFAEKYKVYPVSGSGDAVVFATAEEIDETTRKEMASALDGRIILRLSPAVDVSFAISRAYSDAWAPVPLSDRIGQRLLRDEKIDDKTLRRALRTQRRTDQRLGDILTEMNAISREELEKQEGGSND